MWIKRTPDEVAKLKRQRFRDAIVGAIFMAGIAIILRTFFFGRGQYLVPSGEIFDRLCSSIVWGVVVGVIYLIFFVKKTSNVVCMKCGTIKYKDGNYQCKCGGHFENSDDLKWRD